MEYIRKVLELYDTDGNNQLDFNEIRELLTELNDGEPVEDEDVKLVLDAADRDRSGSIGRMEVYKLIESWLMLAELEDGEDGHVDRREVNEAIKDLGEGFMRAHTRKKRPSFEEPAAPSRHHEEITEAARARAEGGNGVSTSKTTAADESTKGNRGISFSPSTKALDVTPAEDAKAKPALPSLQATHEEEEDEDDEEHISPRAIQYGMTQADYEFVRKILLKYDFSDNGFVELRECAHLLQDLNRGEPLSKDEVRRVFKEHDVDGDSRLNPPEVLALLEKWYANQDVGRVEEVDYSMLKCAIM